MSEQKKLRDLEEQKKMLIAKTTLQRSTFLLYASPIFKVVRALEIGFLAVKSGMTFARHKKHQADCKKRN